MQQRYNSYPSELVGKLGVLVGAREDEEANLGRLLVHLLCQ